MSKLVFKRAVKSESKLRLLVTGPSGSGKTYTALKFAQQLSGGQPFAVGDTENGSASKYGDEFTFDVLNAEPPYTMDKAMGIIKAADEAGYAVVVLDSATHFYKGDGGLLELVQELGTSKYRGNTYAAWNDGSKIYNKFLEAIKQANIHVIITARSKTQYVEDPGRKGSMRRVGMEVEMRDGFEYEFDVFGQMTTEHIMYIEKSRCSKLDGKTFTKPGKEVTDILAEWLKGARALDGETVGDDLLKLDDNCVKFVRAMRKDLGHGGTEEHTAEAITILEKYANGTSKQIAKLISAGDEWDEATLKNLKKFIEKNEAVVAERISTIAQTLN